MPTRLRRNTEKEALLQQKVFDFINKDKRTGAWHASDMIDPRLAIYRRLDPKPPTPEQIGYWLLGRGHHYYFVQAMTGIDDSQEASRADTELGLVYSPDLAELRGEFKTTRLSKKPETEEEAIKLFAKYEQQCLIYAACEGVRKWDLYVLYIALKDEKWKPLAPIPEVYTYTWDEEQIASVKPRLKAQMAIMDTAVKTNSVSGLPLCSEFICVNWKSNGRGVPMTLEPKCPYFEKCKPPGRYEYIGRSKKARRDGELSDSLPGEVLDNLEGTEG